MPVLRYDAVTALDAGSGVTEGGNYGRELAEQREGLFSWNTLCWFGEKTALARQRKSRPENEAATVQEDPAQG
jgi:hypothetical protein